MKWIINVISFLLLIVPYYQSYGATELGSGTWMNQYFFSDYTQMLFLLLFYLMWISIQLSADKKIVKLLKFLSILLSFLFMVYCFLVISIPIQDFIPSIGIYLVMTIFPCLVLLYTLEYIIANKTKENDFEDILDSDL